MSNFKIVVTRNEARNGVTVKLYEVSRTEVRVIELITENEDFARQFCGEWERSANSNQ